MACRETAYPEAEALVGAARSIWGGAKAQVTIRISLSERLEAEMASYGIGPLECVFITDSDIRHIMRGHGNGEEARGQEDVTPEDLGLLPLLLGEFDTCEHTRVDRLGNKLFMLTKRIDNRYYVATAQRGARKLEVKTMWKMPGASC